MPTLHAYLHSTRDRARDVIEFLISERRTGAYLFPNFSTTRYIIAALRENSYRTVFFSRMILPMFGLAARIIRVMNSISRRFSFSTLKALDAALQLITR